MGVKITQDKKIGCLLWMDDVVLISKEKKNRNKRNAEYSTHNGHKIPTKIWS